MFDNRCKTEGHLIFDIDYLLLCKIISRLRSLNNYKHFFCHMFYRWGWGIQKWLSWVYWLRVSYGVAVKNVGLGHRRTLDWIWFQESSVLSLISWCRLLATGLSFFPLDYLNSFLMLAGKGKVSYKVGNWRKSMIGRHNLFYDFGSEVTHCHFWVILLIFTRQLVSGWKETTPRQETNWWPYWMLATKLPVTSSLELE